MIYFTFMILVILCFIIFVLIKNYKISTIDFQNKVQLLESLIKELSQNLKYQNQKVKLSEDLKTNMRQSNHLLSNKIVDLNNEMFEEMFQKKIL
jgi:predicted Holliday junction resolvase-like endonuclease